MCVWVFFNHEITVKKILLNNLYNVLSTYLEQGEYTPAIGTTVKRYFCLPSTLSLSPDYKSLTNSPVSPFLEKHEMLSEEVERTKEAGFAMQWTRFILTIW